MWCLRKIVSKLTMKFSVLMPNNGLWYFVVMWNLNQDISILISCIIALCNSPWNPYWSMHTLINLFQTSPTVLHHLFLPNSRGGHFRIPKKHIKMENILQRESFLEFARNEHFAKCHFFQKTLSFQMHFFG